MNEVFVLGKEDARLIAILSDCWNRLNVTRQEFSHPSTSMLGLEYRSLVGDLERMRGDHGRARATLRAYRKPAEPPLPRHISQAGCWR